MFLLYFRLFTFSDLYWVCLSVFSCSVLFVRISQVIGCEDRLRNDLYCVEWGVKLYSIHGDLEIWMFIFPVFFLSFSGDVKAKSSSTKIRYSICILHACCKNIWAVLWHCWLGSKKGSIKVLASVIAKDFMGPSPVWSNSKNKGQWNKNCTCAHCVCLQKSIYFQHL